MKNTLFCILLLIGFLVSCNNSRNRALDFMVNQVNKNCPMKLDDYTTLKISSTTGNTFTYYYFIDKTILSDYGVSKKEWSTNQSNYLKNFYCESSDLSFIRENNTTLRWKYNDLHGMHFDLFEFDLSDCINPSDLVFE